MTAVLRDKTALVTGGTSGIGLAVVRRFVEEGAHVVLTGRRQAQLDAVAAELGDAVTVVRADASDPADVRALFEAVAARGTGLDAVHVNAGIGELKPLADTLTVQGTLPFLNKGAAIVVTGSTAASGTEHSFGLYGGSKAAVATMTRTWAAELAPRGVRINTVVPGPTETPGLKGLAPGNGDALLEQIASGLPFGRVLRPEEVASVVLFLVSDQSAGMTGSEVLVDGGASIA
jgi:NAD(P)-dependent dehydrogenase (short-subunit alcohol dehydrogenase family)